MLFITAYERRILSGDPATCRAAYDRLTGVQVAGEAPEELLALTAGQPVQSTKWGFAVQMSNALGVYLGKGTPLALVDERDDVVAQTVLDYPEPLPFTSGHEHDLATRAMQARQEAGVTLVHQSVTARERQAEQYGWLAGADNREVAAQRIESLTLS